MGAFSMYEEYLLKSSTIDFQLPSWKLVGFLVGFFCGFFFWLAKIQWLCVLEYYKVNKVHGSQLDSNSFDAQIPQ